MEKNNSVFHTDHHEVRSPTLLIGIGGIGGQIVKSVHAAMSEYDRTYVQMVVMDTNVNDLNKFIGTDIQFIQTSENQTVQDYLVANPEYAEWFPVNPLINAKNLTQGAGQIRSVSRLGALASKSEGRFKAINDAIDALRTNHGDALSRSARVMIVGSATGGTGSGLGVQLPFYVRNVLEDAGVPNVLIRGLFLMPSLTAGVQDTVAKEKAVNVNGYAFLKELNAFYRAQKTPANANPLRIEEYSPGVKTVTGAGNAVAAAGHIPYDFLFLVEKYGKTGSIGGLKDYIVRSAQIVMNQLFSPIAAHGFSVEDNLITSSVPTGGMNRYCGAGIANAIYPKDEVIRYCTVRYAGELIKGYWLQIDDEFRRKDEQQRRMRKANPSLQPLERGTTYCQIFDDMCDPQKQDVSSDVAALKGELTCRLVAKVPTGSGKNASTQDVVTEEQISDLLQLRIREHLNGTFMKTNLAAKGEDCQMSLVLLRNPKAAEAHVSEQLTKLRDFSRDAEKIISDLVLSTAEEILPSDLKLAQGTTKDAKHNIYVMLEKTHPIIARYIMYKLRTAIQTQKKKYEDQLNVDHSQNIFTKDYHYEGPGDMSKESPRDALSLTKPGILSIIGLNSSAYARLITDIRNDTDAEIKYILSKAENTLFSSVYRLVLDRLNTLIELYENFFDELRNIVDNKEEEAEKLEAGKGSKMDEDFKGDKYVCCNPACKKFLYEEFQNRLTDAEREMSDDVKKGFFDQMFGEYATILTEQTNSTAFVTHLSLHQLFEEGVLVPIIAQFSDNAFKHLDMGILDAVKKQFMIENHNKPEAQSEVAFEAYFNKLCANLQKLAEPYLAYNREVDGYKSSGKLNYTWGLNHSAVSHYQSGAAMEAADESKLADMLPKNDTVLVDDSFSPYTMVCYGTIYDLRVENCTAYNANSDAKTPAGAYAERLRNLADQAYAISDEQDGYLDVIHPHLDCRWHEHAYLPELMGNDEDVMQKNIGLAFLLSRTLGLCTYKNSAEMYLTCWWYRKGSEKVSKPVRLNGKELTAQSIYGLYKAFNSNRVIVEDAMAHTAELTQQAKDAHPMDGLKETDMLLQPVVSALVGASGDKINVLDLLYTLLTDSGDRNLVARLIGDLESFLHSYCEEMVGENAPFKTEAFCNYIKKAIGCGSAKLKDPDVSDAFKAELCANFQ